MISSNYYQNASKIYKISEVDENSDIMSIFIFSLDTSKYLKLLSRISEVIDFSSNALSDLILLLCLMAYQLFLGYLMPKPFS